MYICRKIQALHDVSLSRCVYVFMYVCTYMCMYINVYKRCMNIVYRGWLRLVRSSKLSVSFAKEPYKRDDILQKRPIIYIFKEPTNRSHPIRHFEHIFIYVYIYIIHTYRKYIILTYIHTYTRRERDTSCKI